MICAVALTREQKRGFVSIIQAMSRENVEIVRRAYAYYNRTGQVDYAHLDLNVEYDVSGRTFDRAVYHGHEGVRQFLSLLREQWATLRIEPQEFIVSGDDVVVPVRLIARGKQSGVQTTANVDSPRSEGDPLHGVSDSGRGPGSRRYPRVGTTALATASRDEEQRAALISPVGAAPALWTFPESGGYQSP
jgi:ketosteroid isomerase-like protein